jgi:hypothetical protein
MDTFERLKKSFVLTAGGQLVPGASYYKVGAIACVLPTEAFALDFLKANDEDLRTLGIGEPEFIPVGDPWALMRRAAGEGLAGLQCVDPEQPDTFMFMVRVEEAGADLPTVLASPEMGGIIECLTRTGTKRLSHAELLHWDRYDILDRCNARWGDQCPFRYWDQGDPLYELATESLVVLLASVPLMGDWNSPDGAFAFFTSAEEALHYRDHRLGDGRNRMIANGELGDHDSVDLMASLEPMRVDDVASRLQELKAIQGMAAWCINPSGHREDSGFGRLWEPRNDSVHQLRTVAGNWLVRPGNHFERTDDPLAWSGRDTLFWSGGQSIQLLPLDVSFGVDPIRLRESSTAMSEVETEEWVSHFLARSSVAETLEREVGQPPLDGFFISCWDSVTGDRYDPPPKFSGFLEALQFMAAYEREHDEQFRLDGAAACSAIGFVGSGDEGHEALRGERFRQGLLTLGKRHLLHRYHPSYAGNLVALANTTLRTLHVDFAGYAKDLLWASDSETADGLLGVLSIEAETWLKWKIGADAAVDPRGKELALDRVGEGSWANLDPTVQHFLSTALRHLEQQGHAPQLDYAPICIEVVKGLEVELVNVLKGFRDSLAGEVLDATEEDTTLAGFLYEQKKPPTLGAFPYLLRQPDVKPSPLREALYLYLSTLPNGGFLTSNRFAKRDLPKVTNRYRNGGAHSSAIPEDICRGCVEDLVGTEDNPGLIPRVIEWKRRE